jgi:hypothetical protein
MGSMMTKTPRAKTAAFDYSQLGLKQADLEIVLKCETKLLTLGRRTTEETFEAGEQLGIAASLIPDRTFGKWVTAVTRYTRQRVHTIIKIARVLKDHRARLVEARVPDNVMEKLATSPEHLEEVLAEFEAGRRLTGKQVSAVIGSGEEVADIALPWLGGIAGLRANARAKQELVIFEFGRIIGWIIDDVEAALDPARKGKRVLKGRLADRIEHRARLARFQLANIAMPVELDPANAAASRVIPFPDGSKWREVTDLLWVLGGRDSWPREELGPWLSATVLPTLAWSIESNKRVKYKRPRGNDSQSVK